MAEKITLIDNSTGSGSEKQITSASAQDAVYIEGLSSDSVTIQYRPTKNDSKVDASDTYTADTVEVLSFAAGWYSVSRSGNNDQVTVALV